MTAIALAALVVLLWPPGPAARAVTALSARPGRGAAPRSLGDGLSGRTGGIGRRASELSSTRARARAARARALAALRRVLGHRAPVAAPAGNDVVELLDALGAALAAGLTPAEAVRVARLGESAPAVDDVVRAVQEAAADGHPTGPVWERGARRCGHPDLATLARAWTLSERLGCPLSDSVRSAAATARTRTLLQQRLAAATAGARATCTLLSLLPLGGVGMALFLGLDPLTLYASPIAAGSAGLGLVLLLGGRVVVRRMVDSVGQGVR